MNEEPRLLPEVSSEDAAHIGNEYIEVAFESFAVEGHPVTPFFVMDVELDVESKVLKVDEHPTFFSGESGVEPVRLMVVVV